MCYKQGLEKTEYPSAKTQNTDAVQRVYEKSAVLNYVLRLDKTAEIKRCYQKKCIFEACKARTKFNIDALT